MDIDDDTSPEPKPTDSTITPAQRIKELNAIDTSISTLLRSASTATAILSNQDPTDSLSTSQGRFTAAASKYFTTLSSIEVRLRRQVYALEEAGLIQPGDERDARRGRTLNNDDATSRRGGGGPLDPSWLNARASENVELGKKRDLLEIGKRILERTNAAQSNGGKDIEMNEDDG